MQVNKAVVAGVIGAALIVGTVSACSSEPDGVEYVYVYHNGYYDSHHHYHKPYKAKVTRKYYNSHKGSYSKPYKTVTAKPKSSAPKGSVNKTSPRKLGGGSSYRKSGSSSYKRR